MQDEMKVPISNIYYMICYAWDILVESDEVPRSDEEFENIHNLLSSILIKKINVLIKRGFYREYINISDSVTTLKGKLNINESINKNSLSQKQLICEFDELSENVLFNGIIKYTILNLINCPYVKSDIKIQLRKLLFYFNNIDPIPPNNFNLFKIRYDKSNKHYQIIINICYLIYNGLIVNQKDGTTKFLSYLTEERMAKLFENFILNFYKEKLDNSVYKKVKSSKIKWNITGESSDLRYLPSMITDIVLEKKNENKRLIIDTKFYKETLKIQNRFERESTIGKINSNNIYQINTYVNQDKFDGEIIGMLLYPTIDNELNLNYNIGERKIMIKTINLDASWESIENRLLEISKSF